MYSPDADFIGMLKCELPGFWKPGFSKLFARGNDSTSLLAGKKLSPKEKALKAKELRSQGYSYNEIARALGVSKSTVVNYLKDYPYR